MTVQEILNSARNFIPDRKETCPWPEGKLIHYLNINERIIMVKCVRLFSSDTPLVRTTEGFLHDYSTSWKSMKGTPISYALYTQNQCLSLFPIPTVSDTLYLSLYRIPLKEMVILDKNKVQKISSLYHRLLLDGILHRTFLKPNRTAFDVQKAEEHLERWNNSIEPIKREKVLADTVGTTINVPLQAI